MASGMDEYMGLVVVSASVCCKDPWWWEESPRVFSDRLEASMLPFSDINLWSSMVACDMRGVWHQWVGLH